MEVVAFQLALHMAQRGHEITVFTTSEEHRDLVEHHENMTVYRYKPNFTIASAPFSLGIVRKSLKYDMDIIHAHLAAPTAALAGLWHARRKRIPFVVGYSGDLDPGFGNVIRRICTIGYNTFLHGRLLSGAKVIISPAESYINDSRFLPRYRERIVVIPHGIIQEDFNVPHSKKECRERLDLPQTGNIILFAGWLSFHKGPGVLLQSLPEIIKEIPETLVVFLGTGGLRKKLEEMANKLSIEKHVRFAGYIKDRYEKALFFHSADIFVLPSTLTESFGIVSLEAMACGLPVVASNIGGIPDVVKDGENGLLVPPQDPEALAEAIIRILKDRALSNRMSRNGMGKVNDYSWPRIAEEMEGLYNSLRSYR